MLQCAKNLKTDFGAVGNGVADDTTALINAGASGQAVYVPPGTYNWGAGFGLSNNTRLVGAGPGSSILRATTASAYISLGEAAPDTRQNVGLYSLELVASVTRTSAMVKSSNCFDLQLVNLKIGGNGSGAIEINGGANQFKALIRDLLVVSATSGIVLGANPALGVVQDVWILDSLIGSCSASGIDLAHASGVYMANLDIISSGVGVRMSPGSGYLCKGIFMSQALADTCATAGILMAPPAGGKVNNVTLNGCWAATTQSATDSGLKISAGASDGVVSNVIVSSSIFANNKASGISISGGNAKNITLNNCECASNSQILPGSFPGLFIDTAASNVMVNGGIYGGDDSFPANQKYGIHNKSVTTRISNVNTTNNITQGILDEAGGFF